MDNKFEKLQELRLEAYQRVYLNDGLYARFDPELSVVYITDGDSDDSNVLLTITEDVAEVLVAYLMRLNELGKQAVELMFGKEEGDGDN